MKTGGDVAKEFEPKLSEKDLLHFYRMMVMTRLLDERGMKLQRSGRIGFYVTSTGEEATQIGAAAAFTPDDWIFPSYRDPGIALFRNLSLDLIMANLFGNEKDTVKGRQMPVHYSSRKYKLVSISSPIATQITQAVGAAMAARIKKDKIVVGTFFGDGATSAHDFHTGMNFAAVYNAPVVFVCNNNQYAISSPVKKQTMSESIAIKALAYGMEGHLVDGNDVLAVFAKTKAAVDKAREGGGPTLIEAYTYRLGPHSSSDDPGRYRSKEEVDKWLKNDPIARFRHYLQTKRLWDNNKDKTLHDEITQQINDAVKRMEKVLPPPLSSIFEDVYAEMPWHLKEQMHELKEEAKKRGTFKNMSEQFPL
ncbi:MAG: pyruvate dehydrogenase (acetyl-transferring) E1 component subunit alpha [Candidatus Schekmanbacteria bacterium RBG_13_48_7]|uniref:Pyruvate dehydrogenase E1 component subunit alpha n=1 Tax=Candidatus Schekmanbacteria bacterium RBG_13_48_7 TaxID=1817878 RepID=A0A1F7RPF8_9BACT|nr:MAG: pyruvate dehydrogenase (acetyl-transferring) E1 component subunit alpha [Candidatus Schekmanbacteria bacterium RBG_13_48_7]